MRLYFIIHDRGIKLMLDLSNKYKCNKAIKKLKKKKMEIISTLKGYCES